MLVLAVRIRRTRDHCDHQRPLATVTRDHWPLGPGTTVTRGTTVTKDHCDQGPLTTVTRDYWPL